MRDRHMNRCLPLAALSVLLVGCHDATDPRNVAQESESPLMILLRFSHIFFGAL